MGNVNASEDARRYRDGYPGKQDNPKLTVNFEFYSNERASKPEGDLIENIHRKWKGNYGLLEAHHGYIQWLFPIREDGLNSQAEQLQLHEARAICQDPVLKERVITSYELMLDFYGMTLTDKTTGTVERNPQNWRERYAHLNRSFHNYLRITRILKFLGEVELEHFKIHFVMHVLKEIFENQQLRNCRESCIRYWAPVLRVESDRNRCEEYIREKMGANNDSDDDDRRGYQGRTKETPTKMDVKEEKKQKIEETSQATKPSGDVTTHTENVAEKSDEKPAEKASEEVTVKVEEVPKVEEIAIQKDEETAKPTEDVEMKPADSESTLKTEL